MKEIVGVSDMIEVPPVLAWEVISSIGGMDLWFPAVTACYVEGEGVGATRYCMLANGVALKERIEEVDTPARRVRYTIAETTLPLSGYMGTAVVRPVDDGHAEVVWYAEYAAKPEHADEMREMLRNAFVQGIQGLEKYCHSLVT